MRRKRRQRHRPGLIQPPQPSPSVTSRIIIVIVRLHLLLGILRRAHRTARTGISSAAPSFHSLSGRALSCTFTAAHPHSLVLLFTAVPGCCCHFDGREKTVFSLIADKCLLPHRDYRRRRVSELQTKSKTKKNIRG